MIPNEYIHCFPVICSGILIKIGVVQLGGIYELAYKA